MVQPIENLLAKYFAGEATAEERHLVDDWKEKHPDLYARYRKAYQADFFTTKSFQKETPRFASPGRNRNLGMLLKVAAVFVGLLTAGFILFFYLNALNVSYVNTTASVQHISLPDGTEVYLDKGASLQFKKNLLGKFGRHVAMTGRIFFHVFRDTSHPFTVKAGTVQVKVLGTRFTVNRLRMKTQVVLTHGKVLVRSAKSKHLVLLQKPGDQVVVRNNGTEKKNNVKALLYASWMDQKIYFNDCTVKEVLDMLNDSYNFHVKLSDSAYLNKKLFGSAPSDDPQLIVEAISQILHTKIQPR